MQPTSHAAMSGVRRHRTECAEWCGPERSDYTVRAFRPKGCLDGKGRHAPGLREGSSPAGRDKRSVTCGNGLAR